jgi:hypothetical protein
MKMRATLGNGFTDVRVHPSPRPQNAVYVATR